MEMSCEECVQRFLPVAWRGELPSGQGLEPCEPTVESGETSLPGTKEANAEPAGDTKRGDLATGNVRASAAAAAIAGSVATHSAAQAAAQTSALAAAAGSPLTAIAMLRGEESLRKGKAGRVRGEGSEKEVDAGKFVFSSAVGGSVEDSPARSVALRKEGGLKDPILFERPEVEPNCKRMGKKPPLGLDKSQSTPSLRPQSAQHAQLKNDVAQGKYGV